MPDVADKLHVPSSGPPRHRSRLAALAIAVSVAIHGVAAAAVAGLWSDEPETGAQPIEVVLVTLARPGRSAAPPASAAIGAPLEPAGEAGPPDAPLDKAPSLKHAEPVPAPAATLNEAAARTAPPAPRPETADVETADPGPMALASPMTPAIEAAAVERLEEHQAAPDRTAPAEKRPAAGSAVPPPRPIARPGAPAHTAAAGRGVGTGDAGSTPTLVTLASVPAPPGPIAAGTTTSPATFVLGSASNPAPDYPMRARRKGWEGRVVLRVAVDRRGRPADIRVAETSGHAILDEAAHRTVAAWVFRPATRGGRPIAAEALVPVVFRLN